MGAVPPQEVATGGGHASRALRVYAVEQMVATAKTLERLSRELGFTQQTLVRWKMGMHRGPGHRGVIITKKQKNG